MNEKLEKAFCVQINKELYSAYLYLAMQAYFKEINLDGFANWMYVQVQEELAHAMGMYNYVFERGGKNLKHEKQSIKGDSGCGCHRPFDIYIV